MSHKIERSFEPLKNESARQRWDLFHRAIAHAKQSNEVAMRDDDASRIADKLDDATDDKTERPEPQLSIAR